jgi:hypothetical protein
MTLSIVTHRIMDLLTAFSINDTLHNSVECHYAECRDAEYQFFYCYVECHYAECRFAESHYAECRYAECHYAECLYVECR